MSPVEELENKVKSRIINLNALADACEDVVECAEPINGQGDEVVEYVIATEEFELMRNLLVSLGPRRAKK